MPGPTGLRRFTRPRQNARLSPGPAARQPDRDAGASAGTERCEMCAEPLDDRHGHLVDLEQRSLVCACRACYLLFFSPGAGGGRYRAVPEDRHHDPDRPLSVADWDALQVPVGTAFFFINSELDRVVGCYPSPGGATECELNLGAWQDLTGRYPLIGELTPDVQAIFVNRAHDGVDYFRVPIDDCYALVGRVRRTWRGLDGGDETRAALAAFVDELRAHSRPWQPSSDVEWPG